MYKALVFFSSERGAEGKVVCGSIVTPQGASEEFLTTEDAFSAVDGMERSGKLSFEEAFRLREEILESGLPEDGEAILRLLCDSGVLACVALAAARRNPVVSGERSDPIYDRNGRIV